MDRRKREGRKNSIGDRPKSSKAVKDESASQEDEDWEDAEEEDGYSNQNEENAKSVHSQKTNDAKVSNEEDWEEGSASDNESDNPAKIAQSPESEMQETQISPVIEEIIPPPELSQNFTVIPKPHADSEAPANSIPPTADLQVNFHFSEQRSLSLMVNVKITNRNHPTVINLWDGICESLQKQGIYGVCFDIFLDERQLVVTFSKPNNSEHNDLESPSKVEDQELQLARHVSEGQKSRKSRAKSDKRKDRPSSKLSSKTTSKVLHSAATGLLPLDAQKDPKQTVFQLSGCWLAYPETPLAEIEHNSVDVLVHQPATYHTVKTDLTKESALFASLCFSVNQGVCITAVCVVPATGFLKGVYVLKNDLSMTMSHLEINLPECVAGVPVVIPLKNSLRVEKGDAVSLVLCPYLPFTGLIYLHHNANTKSLGSDGSLFLFSGQIPVSAVYYTTLASP